MKPVLGRKISNECCAPGCKERVWYHIGGDPRIYCDEHGGVEPEWEDLTGKQRSRKAMQSSSASLSFKVAEKKRFRELRGILLLLGVDIKVSDYVIEKLAPLIEEFTEKKAR